MNDFHSNCAGSYVLAYHTIKIECDVSLFAWRIKQQTLKMGKKTPKECHDAQDH